MLKATTNILLDLHWCLFKYTKDEDPINEFHDWAQEVGPPFKPSIGDTFYIADKKLETFFETAYFQVVEMEYTELDESDNEIPKLMVTIIPYNRS